MKAYTVAQINSYIKNMFSQDYMLQSVAVKGEVSNLTYHRASGHIYFTLKDKQSVLSCVMFAGSRSGLSFTLEEGMQIVVSGNIDLYERDGKYQMYAKKITKEGIGELAQRFEALKLELEERGLFAVEYKQPIPAIAKRIGVVTAPTGAAVRDIISISKTRNPYIEIILYPALVQGEGAAPSIVKGIRMLDSLGVDTIIVGRGGGSIEDLWAFNEEIVAQAIFDCKTPIISAVGHETDFTIADFVADRRAETPSAAAQIAVCEMDRMSQGVEAMREDLIRAMNAKIDNYRNRVLVGKTRIQGLSPANRLKDKRFRTMQCEDILKTRMKAIIEARRYDLGMLSGRLHGVSPLDKLSQGFSYTKDSEGKAVNSISRVAVGDEVGIYVSDGIINAKVTGTEKTDW